MELKGSADLWPSVAEKTCHERSITEAYATNLWSSGDGMGWASAVHISK